MSIWRQLMALVRRLYHRLVGAVGGHDAQVDLLRKRGMRIGKNCRIYTNHFGVEPWLIRIGDHCTLTSGVRLVTHDGACWVVREQHPGLEDFGPIIIHDNCFLGVNAVVLPAEMFVDETAEFPEEELEAQFEKFKDKERGEGLNFGY